MTNRCLGRIRPTESERSLVPKLAKYVDALPAAPPSLDLTHGIPQWPTYLNTQLGDCTCAAVGHCEEVFSYAATGTPFIAQDSDILALYETQGYVPGDPSTDHGAVETSVLNQWRIHGFANGRKLHSYASVDVSDLTLVRQCTWIFYGLYIGIALPLSAQSQSEWDVDISAPSEETQPGSWGGHAVNVVGYSTEGLTVITWGAPLTMTWRFWENYVDEAYALIPNDFETLPNGKLLSNGFNATQLQSDMDAALSNIDIA